MSKIYSHLSYNQRLKIKQLLDLGYSKREIAMQIGMHFATVYREIERGSVNMQYDPFYAEEKYRNKLKNRGNNSILDEDPTLAEYISDLILEKN